MDRAGESHSNENLPYIEIFAGKDLFSHLSREFHFKNSHFEAVKYQL